MRYKCGKCKDFHELMNVHFAKCKDCNYVTARCEEKGCDGLDGARRSITSHVGWYRGMGVKKYGYDDFHNPLPKVLKKNRRTTKTEKAGIRRASSPTMRSARP